jgi:hypothetical protein
MGRVHVAVPAWRALLGTLLSARKIPRFRRSYRSSSKSRSPNATSPSAEGWVTRGNDPSSAEHEDGGQFLPRSPCYSRRWVLDHDRR